MENVSYWGGIGIGLFTGVFAIPVYIVFLYMLIRYRNLDQFNIPFYHLVFQCGLLDIWFVIHEYLMATSFLVNNVLVKIAMEMFLWAKTPIATIGFHGYFYIRACQAVSVLGISLNRFTALCMPLRHALIWTPKMTWMMVIVQHFVAILVLSPALGNGCFRHYLRVGNGTEYTYNRLSPYCIALIVGPSIILVVVLSVTLIVLYSVMFCKVRQSNTAVGHGVQAQNEQKVQRSLAIGGAIISGTLVLNSCFLLLAMTALRRPEVPKAIGLFRKTLDMVFCVVNPFVLLCFGSKVRPYYWKCVKQIFCIKQNEATGHNNNNQPINQRNNNTVNNNNNIIANNWVVEENNNNNNNNITNNNNNNNNNITNNNITTNNWVVEENNNNNNITANNNNITANNNNNNIANNWVIEENNNNNNNTANNNNNNIANNWVIEENL